MEAKKIPCLKIDDVSEITLLSKEEWNTMKYIAGVPLYCGYWWLRTPFDSNHYTRRVHIDGSAESFDRVSIKAVGVRPAFTIKKLSFEIGEKVFIENTLCTVVEYSKALSDQVVCLRRFDGDDNDFEKSEIKRFINSDEFKELL